MPIKTYKIYTLGCKVNQYDSVKLGRDLKQLGLAEAKLDADLAIVNTCTVTMAALAKDKKMLDKARLANPRARVAIVGCMPANYRKEAEALGVDYIFGTRELDKFVEAIKPDVASPGCELSLGDYKTDRSRYFLKIQDGCQQFCSYCIIPHNRGQLSSRIKEEVVSEVGRATEAGFVEVVLCGIHLGLYGVDQPLPKYLLADLLADLFENEDLKKIRLSSIEISEVNDRLIGMMQANRKFARHLHIPLQAGSDKVLKSMNRPYDIEYFAARIAKLREAVPDVAISTDVIVGFPGETDEDFQATLDFSRQIGFSKIHVFPFSAHEKTPAYSFSDQVSDTVKKRRAQSLQELSEELAREYNGRFLGRTVEAIIDARSRDGHYRAKSEYYFDLEFESEEKYRVGELISIKDWSLL